MIYWPSKTVGATQRYGLDWGPTLSELDDPPPTILNSVWQVLRGAGTVSTGLIDDDGQRTFTLVGGGASNAESVFRNSVTLSDGQILTEDVFIKTRG